MKNERRTHHVLIVGDQQSKLDQLAEILRTDYPVFFAPTKAELESQLTEDIAVIIAEQQVLEASGVDFLENAFETHPGTFWILLGKDPRSTFFAQTMKKGQIYHYLKDALEPEEMAMLVTRALEHYHLFLDHKDLLKEFQTFQKQNQASQIKRQKIKGKEQPKDTSLPHRTSDKFYQEFRDTLDQIIHSNKMATLGQMVAGLAHEINSPSGAINAAIVNMIYYLKSLIESFEVLDKQGITRKDFQRMMGIVSNMASALDHDQRRSPGEIRDEQKRVFERLQRQNIPNSQNLAKHIARMDLAKNIDAFLSLVEAYDTDSIVLFFTNCSRIINSAKDIKLSTTMLTRLIKALKSYSYPKQEKPELTDIRESIDTALAILNHKLKHQIQIECQHGDVPKIWCYTNELSHVWINIINNAIQAINGKGEINIETFTTDQYLGVKITDNGLGIPTEILDQIFDINFTTKPLGEGTGLGLYIAHQIIKKHGGTIDVVSTPGKTIFEVHLPLAIAAPYGV